MKTAVGSLTLAAMMVLGTSSAWAHCRSSCCAAPCDYGWADCGCGYSGGCGYTLQYHTEYQQVHRTVWKCVPETHQEEVSETVSVPMMHEEERWRTYCVPVMHQETRQQAVCHMDYRTEEREVTELVAQNQPYTQTYSVCVPETHMEKGMRTVSVPVVSQEVRHETCMVYHSVPEVVTHQVVCCHQIPVYDCCGCCCGCQCVQDVQNVSCTVYRCVPETQVHDYTVNVCHYTEHQESYEYPVMTSHMEQRTQTCYRTVCVPVTRKVPVQVCVPTTVMQNYTVNVCSMEEKKEAYKVQVCDYKQEVHKHMIDVTTWKNVSEDVVENVPVTTCVQVPCAPVSYAPCYGPAYNSGCGCSH